MTSQTLAAGSHTSAYTFSSDNYTVVNVGNVSVTNGTAIAFTGAADTLINAGAVSGASYAALFAAGSANRLIIDPGATFSGTVSGGNTIGGTAVSVLELASAAGIGAIGGIGSQFIDFASIQVDAGAYWSVGGADAVGAGVFLANAGTLSGTALTLDGGGTLDQNSTAAAIIGVNNAVYGNASGPATVMNLGVISGGVLLGAGVYLRGGGSMYNEASGGAQGVISGNVGVRARGAMTLTNAGSISGTRNGQGIYLLAGGTITNLRGGMISAANGNAIQATNQPAAVNNYGIVRTSTSTAASGVLLAAGGGVTNNVGGLIAGRFGVSIAGAAGTVTNAGVVSGTADAVMLASGVANRVIIDPGGTFAGTVDGGNAPGGATYSTLELASGASVGALSGLATRYIDFAHVTVDPGGHWNLGDGGNSVGAGITLANAGTLDGATGSAGTYPSGSGDTGGLAVSVAAGGSLNNSGSVAGGNGGIGGAGSNGSAGTLGGTGGMGGQGGGGVQLSAGTISNSGMLTGGQGGNGGPGGSNGGPAGARGAGGPAVYGSTGVVDNTGTILGGGGNVGGMGVSFSQGGTITNLFGGLIAGYAAADAIQFGIGTSRLSVAPGATFAGTVDGGNTTGSAVSTLELISAAATGTIDGLGSAFIDFASIQVDPAARWVMGAGANTIESYATLTNAGTLSGAVGAAGTYSAGAGSPGTLALWIATGGSLDNNGVINGGTGGVGGKGLNTYGANAGAPGIGGIGGQGAAAIVASATITNNGAIAGGTGGHGGQGGTNYQNANGTIFAALGVVGGAAGAGGVGLVLLSGGVLNNKNLIVGGAGGYGGPDGVTDLLPPRYSGAGGTGAAGVNGTTGSIVNSGVIEGGTGGIITSYRFGSHLAASGPGISFSGGATITNQPGGTIAGKYGAPAILFGTGTSRLVMDPGAVVVGVVDGGTTKGAISTLELASAATSGTINGVGTQFVDFSALQVDAGAYWTVGNQFIVQSGITLSNAGTLGGSPVSLAAGGALYQSANASIIASGSGGGTATAVYGRATGPVTISNQGLIRSGTSAASVFLMAGGTLSNGMPGVISSLNVAVRTEGFIILTNAGSIGGTNGGLLATDGGTVTNVTGGIISGAFGISIAGAAGTVTNAGVISGIADAVTLASGFANRVILDPGGTFTGIVDGGNAAGAAAYSTVELASGASTGTLSSQNARFVNFSRIMVDRSARWLLAPGANTIGALVTLTNAGTLNGYAGMTGTLPGGQGGGGLASLAIAAGGSLANLGYVSGGAGGAGGAGSDGSAGTLAGAGGTGGRGGAGVQITNATISLNGTVAGGRGGNGGAGGAGISGGAGGMGGAGGAGVQLAQAGTLINDSHILGGAGGYGGVGGASGGVAGARGAGGPGIYGSFAVIGNAGTIAGGGGTVGGVGVTLSGGGTITNQAGGLIAGYGGADAIQFGTGTSRVIFDPGAAFIGTVDGGNTSGGAISTLELGLPRAAGSLSAQGTLSGFGTQFVNFAQIQIDPDAAWALGDGDSLAAATPVVDDGGLLISGQTAVGGAVTIASTSSAIASETITANGSWSGMSTLVVGDAGLGSLVINAGGKVTTTSGATIADTTGASGSSVNVSGAASNLQVAGSLIVGAAGFGQLSVSRGATVTAASLDMATTVGASGQLGIVDAGSDLIVSGTAAIADQDSATLSILNGGSFQASFLNIGTGSATGALTVAGPGTDFHVTNDMTVGANGIFSIGNAVTVFIDGNFNEIGAVNQGGGSLIDPSTVTNSSPHGGGGGSQILASGSITNNSTYFVGDNNNGSYILTTPLIIGTGVLEADPASNAGAEPDLVLNTGSIGSGQTLVFGGQSAEITLGSDKGTMAIAGLAAGINGFVAGDTLVVTTTAAAGFQLNGSVVSVVDNVGGAIEGTLAFANASLASLAATTSGALVDQVRCFAAGTRIATEHGALAVEALRVGDRLVTHDGVVEPIVWIGQRTVHCARQPRPKAVWPVRIAAGAFGASAPERDLYLSPDHAVFVDGALIPVKLLVNGTSIAQVRRDQVTYFHLELRCHEVVLAENLPVESYLDTVDRANLGQDGLTRLLSERETRRWQATAVLWETHGVAPLVTAGARLVAARGAVMTRQI